MAGPFMQKQPCMVSRVLCLHHCPPHDVLHDPLEYPVYYDPVYYPQLHADLFQNLYSVRLWLRDGIHSHPGVCQSCLPTRSYASVSDVVIEYSDGYFTISCLDAKLVIAVRDIESSAFNFCRLIRDLQHPSARVDWSDSLQIVFSQNPPWLYRDDGQYVQALDALSRSDLQLAAHAIQTTGRTNERRKADYIHIILHDFIRERIKFMDSTLDPSHVVPDHERTSNHRV
jgi:hypothetical protein